MSHTSSFSHRSVPFLISSASYLTHLIRRTSAHMCETNRRVSDNAYLYERRVRAKKTHICATMHTEDTHLCDNAHRRHTSVRQCTLLWENARICAKIHTFMRECTMNDCSCMGPCRWYHGQRAALSETSLHTSMRQSTCMRQCICMRHCICFMDEALLWFRRFMVSWMKRCFDWDLNTSMVTLSRVCKVSHKYNVSYKCNHWGVEVLRSHFSRSTLDTIVRTAHATTHYNTPQHTLQRTATHSWNESEGSTRVSAALILENAALARELLSLFGMLLSHLRVLS